MADKAKTLYKVENTQGGSRGLYTDSAHSFVEPGATVLAELTDEDKEMADKHGYFTITKATAADKKAVETPPAPSAPEPDAKG